MEPTAALNSRMGQLLRVITVQRGVPLDVTGNVALYCGLSEYEGV